MFNFIDSIKKGVSSIYNMLVGVKEAPSISMTFDNKYLTGTYKIIDLSWYSPYKDIGDFIITVFIYMCFIWNCFVHASSIINGVGGGFHTSAIVMGDYEYSQGKHSLNGGGKHSL